MVGAFNARAAPQRSRHFLATTATGSCQTRCAHLVHERTLSAPRSTETGRPRPARNDIAAALHRLGQILFGEGPPLAEAQFEPFGISRVP